MNEWAIANPGQAWVLVSSCALLAIAISAMAFAMIREKW